MNTALNADLEKDESNREEATRRTLQTPHPLLFCKMYSFVTTQVILLFDYTSHPFSYDYTSHILSFRLHKPSVYNYSHF